MARPHRRAERHHGHLRAVRAFGERGVALAVDRGRCACHGRVSGVLRQSRLGQGDARGARFGDRRRIDRPRRRCAIKTAAFAHLGAVRRPRRRAVRAALGLRHAVHLRLLAVDPVRAGGDDRRRGLRGRAAGRRGDRGAAARAPRRARRVPPAVLRRAAARRALARAGGPRRKRACAWCRSRRPRRDFRLPADCRLRSGPRAALRGRGPRHLVRRRARGARHLARGEARRGHQPDRPERRRQDHGAQHAERLLSPRRRHDPPRRTLNCKACRRGASRAPASRAPTRPRSSSAR